MEILGGGPVEQDINRQLRTYLDQSPKGIAAYFAKRRESLGEGGPTGDDELLTEPVYWTKQWLSIRFYTWASGMGRNGISWGYRTWDLATGQRVDLWGWFGGQSSYPDGRFSDGSAAMPSKLRRLVFRKIDTRKIEPACEKYYDPGAEFQLTLEKNGMRFSQPAYGDGCELEFGVAYTRLLPLLDAEGKAAVLGILHPSQ